RAGRRKAARPPGGAVRAGRGGWSGVGGHVQVHDDRRVVGGALALALLAVHVGVGDRLGERLVAVDQVDAHAPALGEAQLAVVPVREGMLVLQGARDDVRQTGPAQGGEGGPLGGRDVGGALEAGPVVAVVVGRRHVVVAHHGERAAAGRVTGDGGPQRLQPLELVDVVRVVHLPAVGHVHGPDADRSAGGGDRAGLHGAVVTGIAGQ